ncbi:Transcriptional regulator DauR [Eubacterium plexicaudatum ASF492]|uniref:PAC domain-containing protein n=1 Tax=Eubacterium plexicaudatum ASF492 TaxID=1235802 RepID=N2A3X1_9FIRM|nr:Transcriptional regulator DauR [Eubacterium plexicaudatum ASF492]
MTPDMLQQYSVIVQFLGKTLGPDYEIVLHDLRPDHNQIVAIANNHISGRNIGSPLTNASLKMLIDKAYETDDFLCNYKGIAENGHLLRSSTMFIKDTQGNPVGLLCINFDDSRFLDMHDVLLSIIHPKEYIEARPFMKKSAPGSQPVVPSDSEQSAITENFSMDIPSLMHKMFADATVAMPTPADRLNQQEKKDIIEKLHKQGLFQLKGAITFVAEQFACSSATIYRYLSELKLSS